MGAPSWLFAGAKVIKKVKTTALRHQVFIIIGADLTGTDLTGTDLTEAVLIGADASKRRSN